MDIYGVKSFLVLLLIVLTQHINFSSSAQHGSRPKRQYGANLYLPETFIIPEGEGDSSQWGPWSSPSECSRSCGGGVAYQTRECLNGRGCSGGDKKYFSCNIQDCPETEPDFRRYQCSQFDRTPFEGVYYSWIPYTKAPNPCELNCMPVGERFYYRHKSKVTDGTRCNDESFDVCVDGTCQPVGCDLMLGSDAKEDKCRTCQGDGSSCKTVTGLLDMDNLQVGYNDILLIPAGATNVDIKERSPSNNYVAIRNLTGIYYLNGNYRIDFPRPMSFAGTIWHYERKPQGFAAPDRLHCIGPTTEAVYLVLLSQDRNVGINYEYSVPQLVAPEEPDSYAWTYTPFEACSKSCGGGHQSRNVSCNSRRSLQQVDESLCDSSQKPAEWQKCGNLECAPQWIEEPWSKCSKSCGEGGEQKRGVVCKRISADGIESIVEDDVCLEAVGNKPATVKECHMGTICPQWFISKWTPCSKLCGEGKQTRKVQCYRKEENGKITILEDDDCLDEKPDTEMECMLRPCEGVDYITSSWSGCDACGSTVETRKVYCASKNGKIYDDKFCENREKPELSRPCIAPPCDFMWFASQWSKCSAICGKGVQTRTVVCGMFDGESVKKADDDSKCDADDKPEVEKECEAAEECPAQWFSGPWSDCSKKCGIGDRTRKVICIAGNETVDASKCPEEKILYGSETCNMGPCNDDDLIPIDTTSAPIEDDDDEEYCDEEDYDDDVTAEDRAGLDPEDTSEDSVTKLLSTDYDMELTSETSAGSDSTLLDDELMLSDSTIYGDETLSTDWSEDSTDTSIIDGSGDDTSISSISKDSTSDMSSSDKSSESSLSSDLDSTTISSDGAESSSSDGAESSSSDGSSTIDLDNTSASTIDSSSDTSSIDSSTSGDIDISTSSDDTTIDTTPESSTSDDFTESSTATSEDTSTTDSSEQTTLTDDSSTVDGSSSTISDISSSVSSDASTSDLSESSTVTSDDGSSSLDSSSTVSSDGSTSDLSESSTVSDDLLSSSSISSMSSLSTIDDEETDSSDSSTVSSDISSSSGVTDASESTDSTDSTEEFTAESDGESDASKDTMDTTDTTISLKDFEIETIKFADVDIWTTETSLTDETATTYSIKDILKTRARKCKPRPTKPPACLTSSFGCCQDNKTAAAGPFDEGCEIPENCETTKHGCCPDGLSPALGPKFKGCPESNCNETLFGCCPDEVTPSEGNDNEGCPEPTTTIKTTTITTTQKAIVPAKKVTEKPSEKPAEKPADCSSSEFGCCEDGTSKATGKDFKGCTPISDCVRERFGCCPDKVTPAHGPLQEGCCLGSEFGCCSDQINAAQGPNGQGCSCEYSPYGCCPDNTTSATGHNNEGCGCQYNEHGCCLDRVTPASGPDFEGCPCHTYQFGCCPDGETTATGPHNQGCHCKQSKYGCCKDNKTPAKGPDSSGCDCANSEFGCCLDGVSESSGKNFEGCETAPISPQKACSLKKDMGTCNNFTVKYFFDIEYGGCSRFWYGGCDGNDNRFDSNEECRSVCEQPEGQGVCELPKIVGPCTAYYPMWYYDSDRNMCSQFIYGGCLGNANRFEKQEDCQSQCVVDEKIPECDQPIVEGPCQGQFERWAYDKDSDSCRPFTYGGCKGNKNNYASEGACHYHCKKPGIGKKSCSLPNTVGSCDEKKARWFFSQSDNKCMPFYYTNCGGNENNYESYELCVNSCPPVVVKDACELPADIGDCQNYTANWYFDTKSQRCRQFYYGGCGGNDNNFKSERDCENRCAKRSEVTVPARTVRPPPQPVEPEPTEPTDNRIDPRFDGRDKSHCLLRYDAGSCSDESIRYYYDSYYGVCSHFRYTGCGGNENNFETFEECEDFCRDAQDTCKLLPYYGRCSRENTTRWHYDQYDQECKQFVYGGCEGNKNNFEDRRSCERACSSSRPEVQEPPKTTSTAAMCQQPQNYGDCHDNIISYFFNVDRDHCEAFYYSGCGGNENRFVSLEQCERRCGEYKDVDVCRERQNAGSCDGTEIKYYYDARERSCKEFTYSGCDGNGNRFASIEECESVCISNAEPTSGEGREPQRPRPPIQPPETPDCRYFEDECNNLGCPYGILKSYDNSGCTRCQCEDPCHNYECPENTQCSVDVSLGQNEETIFVPLCRKIHKSGQCPRLAEDSRCDVECHTDADCRGDHKCCAAGCSRICTLPYQPEPEPETEYATRSPYAGAAAPVLEPVPQEEVDVDVSEGGVATLKCYATGFPPPTITWRRHGIELNTNQGRFVLTSSGDLQIVQVHRTDSGVYVCVASNGIGRHVEREVALTVSDPVESPAYIVGPSNSTILSTLSKPITLRCMAGGYPKPFVTWWRGKDRLPLQDNINNRFEVTRDHSFVYHRVELHDLGVYTCHAYNAVGKPVSIDITLQAQGPVNIRNEADKAFLPYIVNIPETPTTQRHYVPPRVETTLTPPVAPIDEVDVPLTANLVLPEGHEYNTGTNIELTCEITGQPEPEIIWYKDDQDLYETDRIRFTDRHRLIINSGVPADSGRYKCYVRNRFSEAYAEEVIRVEGPYLPHGCIDNPFFANCALIVKGNYCNHHYYAKFCCKSCTLAGQLRGHPNQI